VRELGLQGGDAVGSEADVLTELDAEEDAAHAASRNAVWEKKKADMNPRS
jgi:hypothetical protein